MTSQGWLQIGLTLLIGLLISIPVGRYLARVTTGRKTPFDRGTSMSETKLSRPTPASCNLNPKPRRIAK
jgi:K+-transporting ATPase A subunit